MPTPHKQLIKSAQQKWGMIRKAYTVSLVQCVVLPDRIRIFTICLFLLFSFTCQVFHQLREVQKNIQLEKLKVVPKKKSTYGTDLMLSQGLNLLSICLSSKISIPSCTKEISILNGRLNWVVFELYSYYLTSSNLSLELSKLIPCLT